MLLHRIYISVVVALSYHTGYLVILFLLLNKVSKYQIEEICIGVDNLFSFYFKNIKIKIGLTFIVGTGLKVVENENADIREKDLNLFGFFDIAVTALLLAAALVLGRLNILTTIYYLLYFCFMMDVQQLKICLHHFNGFDFAAGVCELAVIYAVLRKLILRFMAENKTKRTIYSINTCLIAALFIRLLYDYLFQR